MSSPERERPLTEQEEQHKEGAQEAAGMLRAHLEVSPASGDIFAPYNEDVEGGDPTAEDYDAALAAIEELRETAQNESGMKTINVLARLAQRSKFAVQMLLAGLGPAGLAIEAEHERAMSKLDSASTKLRKLKEKAELYDKPGNSEAVKNEQEKLRNEIDAARKESDRLEADFDHTAEIRAAINYSRALGREGVEGEKQTLRIQIDTLRRDADDKENGFNAIARGRASMNYRQPR